MTDLERPDPRVCIPLLVLHGGCLLAVFTGASPVALGACAFLFVVRMFGLTAGYHRYFSHRSYRTGRGFQLLLAVLGASAAQLGPLWWAGHHRRHHAHTDTEEDPHSPAVRGLWWAHMGWLLCRRYSQTDLAAVPDLARYAELRFLDRNPLIAPLALAVSIFGLGAALEAWAPSLGTSGPQLLAWGFFVSTTLLFHTTLAVNSVGHRFGRRSFDDGTESRNNVWLALFTLGDGWHNNHHRYPASARHGLGGWEFDPTHRVLRVLEALGLVWDLRGPPEGALPSVAARRPV